MVPKTLKIAFISYEYPPETGGGGIGTYLSIIAPAIQKLGHKVVVFAGTKKEESFWENDFVYRIPCRNTEDFDDNTTPHFKHIHEDIGFDIIEGTDYSAWGLSIKKQYPEIPLVLKLHTPSFLVDLLQFQPLAFQQKLRFIFGALRRFKIPHLPVEPKIKDYLHEVNIFRIADAYSSPSKSILSKLVEFNVIDHKTPSFILPIPLSINENILKIESRKVLTSVNIIFIGRLEIRKGVIELSNAIPLILNKHPDIKFTFVGRAANSPKKQVDMISYLSKKLQKYSDHITFTGGVPHEKIAAYLETGDIFIFPSHYESFGIVCTEAMAAGKAVIGSKNGGMVEILDNGNCGLMTEINSVEIAKNISRLILDSELRSRLGELARERVLNKYNLNDILNKQIDIYNQIIDRKKPHG